jgi:hypothetical protein
MNQQQRTDIERLLDDPAYVAKVARLRQVSHARAKRIIRALIDIKRLLDDPAYVAEVARLHQISAARAKRIIRALMELSAVRSPRPLLEWAEALSHHRVHTEKLDLVFAVWSAVCQTVNRIQEERAQTLEERPQERLEWLYLPQTARRLNPPKLVLRRPT